MDLPPLSIRTRELVDLENRHSAGGYDPVPVFIVRAKEVKIWVRCHCS